MYIFLYTVFFIIFIIFLFYIFNTSQTEHFNNANSDSSYYIITQTFVKEFDIDNYKILNDKNKEIYKIDGKWNLDVFYLYIQKDKKKIPIKNIDNSYQFKSNNIDTKIIYRPDGDAIGQLILNNYEDELNVYRENDNYIFKSGSEIVAKIEKTESKTDKNKFKLNIANSRYNKFLDSFIVCFIIFNHIEKQLNFSHG